MGGAIAHFGNISPVAEANFAFDAASRRIVAAYVGAARPSRLDAGAPGALLAR